MTQTHSLAHNRSILGPLILITFGIVWLLGAFGVISSSNLWAVLRYWPLLLIALGVDAILRWRWPLAANLVSLAFVGLALAAVIFAPRLGLSANGSWMNFMPFTFGGQPATGPVISENRSVSGFDAVTFSGIGDLTIQVGEREGLTIEAQEDVLAAIRTQVRGGTLTISLDEPIGWGGVRPTKAVRYTLTVVSLSAIDLSGAGDVTLNSVETDRLQARLSGAGNMTLNDLQSDVLVSNISGAGSLKASGAASRLEVMVSGVGGFNGSDLRSDDAEATISGTGSATVWAVEHLTARISGLGSIRYYGQPVVNEMVSGLGNVHHLGNR